MGDAYLWLLPDGVLFSSCICERNRMVVLRDDITNLEKLAKKYECEEEMRSKVQKVSSQDDSTQREDESIMHRSVAEGLQFESSLSTHAKVSEDFFQKPGDTDDGSIFVQSELCDGVASSVCGPAQEEEESDMEVFQVKRRRMSPPQSKRFQVDEQEIAPEKSAIDSSLILHGNVDLKLTSVNTQAMGGGAETCKPVVARSSGSNDILERSEKKEMARKRENPQGPLLKVKRKQPIVPKEECVLPEEFDVDSEKKQIAESQNTDPGISSKSSIRSSDEAVPFIAEGKDEKVTGLLESGNIVPEVTEAMRTLSAESGNKDSEGRCDNGLIMADDGSPSYVKVDSPGSSSNEAVRIETDPAIQITGHSVESSAAETNFLQDLSMLSTRNTVSKGDCMEPSSNEAVMIKTDPAIQITGTSVGSSAAETILPEDSNLGNDSGQITPRGTWADEGIPCHVEGDHFEHSSSESSRCETDPSISKASLQSSSLGEARPLVDLGVHTIENYAPSSTAETKSWKDCCKLTTASVPLSEPKKGLVIHLNRKVEPSHKKKVAENIYNEEKSNISDNLLDEVGIFEGQSEGSAWCLDQEVVSSYSGQNEGLYSPSEQITSICGGDLVQEILQEKFGIKSESLLEEGKMGVEHQGPGNTVGLQHDIKFPMNEFSLEASQLNNCGTGRQGESSGTPCSLAMPPRMVHGYSSFTPSSEPNFGVLENIDAMPCRSETQPTGFYEWQKAELSHDQVTNEVHRELFKSDVCVLRDGYFPEFVFSEPGLGAYSCGLDSSLCQRDCFASNFVDKPSYPTHNHGGVRTGTYLGPSKNWSGLPQGGGSELFPRQSPGHAPAMSRSHRFRSISRKNMPYSKPRSFYRNQNSFHTDSPRSVKYPRIPPAKEKMPFCHWERRPNRHYSRGWRGDNLEINKSSSGADNLGVKGVFDRQVAGGAESTATGSVYVEGYDPMKWEISPVANPRQLSSAHHSVWTGNRH